MNPDGIVFEPATQTVWAFNGRSKDATVIDATTQKVVATIPLPGKPEFPAVDGHGTVFDNIEDKSEIVRLDAHARKLTAEWPAGCQSPSGLAFDVSGHRLFTVCDGKKMAVVDSESGKVLATPAIGDGPDAARWDAKHQLAFASCGEDGVLSVVDASKPSYPSIENLPTQKGARTMAYDPATDRIYLVTASLRARAPGNPHQPAPPTRHASRQLHRDCGGTLGTSHQSRILIHRPTEGAPSFRSLCGRVGKHRPRARHRTRHSDRETPTIRPYDRNVAPDP